MIPLHDLRSLSLSMFLIGYFVVNSIAQIPTPINPTMPYNQAISSNSEEKGDYWAGQNILLTFLIFSKT